MKNIILTCLAAVLLFSLSAAVSLYLQNPGFKRDKDAGKADDPSEKSAAAKKDKKEDPATPIAQQPPANTNEQVTKLLTKLQDRDLLLKKREDDLRKQEARLEIIMDDIRGERAGLDALRKQFTEEMNRLNEKQDNINKKSRGLEEQKESAAKLLAEMRKRQVELDKGESANLTRMATISDSMPPEKAAAILKQLADGGQMDTAVKLLGQMKERRAAQVLAELTDVALAAQLLDKLRGFRRSTTPPAGAPGGAG